MGLVKNANEWSLKPRLMGNVEIHQMCGKIKLGLILSPQPKLAQRPRHKFEHAL